jgi:hypothetical protein
VQIGSEERRVEHTGIGVTFDERAMAKHPSGPNNFLRVFENGWERRTGGSPE